jgi:23S rRNA (cytosine1962-C5)-methyltransferase
VPQPDEWTLSWGGIELLAKPTNFGHLGFFPEQATNWRWLRDCIAKMPKGSRTLNLFAYSGGASVSMAQAGAEVCHLDASKGIIEWAKRNQSLNRGAEHIRCICDDAMKFVSREVRRGSKYGGIVLDPPSFGRGAQGQVWKIEDGIKELLQNCKAILDLENPHFILLSCHSQGFSPLSLGRCLGEVFKEDSSIIECGEMMTPEADAGKVLPAGLYARLFKI